MRGKKVIGRPLAGTPAIREFALERLQTESSRKVVKAIQEKFGVKLCFNTVLNWKNISPERSGLDRKRLVELAPKIRQLLKEYKPDEIITILKILEVDKDASKKETSS